MISDRVTDRFKQEYRLPSISVSIKTRIVNERLTACEFVGRKRFFKRTAPLCNCSKVALASRLYQLLFSLHVVIGKSVLGLDLGVTRCTSIVLMGLCINGPDPPVMSKGMFMPLRGVKMSEKRMTPSGLNAFQGCRETSTYKTATK